MEHVIEEYGLAILLLLVGGGVVGSLLMVIGYL